MLQAFLYGMYVICMVVVGWSAVVC